MFPASAAPFPEYKFDLKNMIELLIQDKKENPSNYSIVVLSEGAEWEGYAVREYGEADAFGHRKKANVGEDLSDEIKKASGQETVVSDLTYELRSGSPDFIDKLVATTFASMAMDCIAKGEHGLMTAINKGCFAMEPIPDPKLGPRHVDVANMYDTERYLPKYEGKLGLPIFLTQPLRGEGGSRRRIRNQARSALGGLMPALRLGRYPGCPAIGTECWYRQRYISAWPNEAFHPCLLPFLPDF